MNFVFHSEEGTQRYLRKKCWEEHNVPRAAKSGFRPPSRGRLAKIPDTDDSQLQSDLGLVWKG